MSPRLHFAITACLIVTGSLGGPDATAQDRYGDSVWTGQTNLPPQQARTAQPPAGPQRHSVPQPRRPSPDSHHQTQVYGGLPDIPVVTASAQGPTAKREEHENTSVPSGRPVSTGTDLTPINGADRESVAADSSGGILQTIVSVGSSLLIVGGLFFGLVWVYRKTANTTLGGGLPKGVVNVLGRAPIAARQQMVLVRFGSKLVLVSVVQGDARTISEITDPLEVDRLTGLCESAKPDSSVQSFRSFLSEGSKA